MFRTVLSFVKPLVAAVLLLTVLQVTGLLGSVAFFAQTALMKTGINDARSELLRKPVDFNYNFTLRTMAGERISFDQFKGKVVFLNMWATWCGPCRVEMPGIQNLFNTVQGEDIMFVMLSVDKDSDKMRVVRYIEKNQFTFPVFQPSGYLTEQLNVPTIPTTFIISRQGKIVAREVGATNFDTERFRKFLEGLAKQ